MNQNRSFEEKYFYCSKSLGLDNDGTVNFELQDEWLQTFLAGESMFYVYTDLKSDLDKTEIINKINGITLSPFTFLTYNKLNAFITEKVNVYYLTFLN